ncbi:DUF241 domain protein [Quillaja saponaria]|uniref:DUF241 domain protein n=1 Tax=Quillaja saponaria TaxID=32244 RepID=A0AAD7L9I1_QUISA|nr:DUF241 domain protein [Quillaja saponaria]
MMKRATMGTFSPKASKSYKIRSISLPTRSHPSTHKIEEELNKLRAWEASSSSLKVETICSGLSGLGELYKCIEDLLKLPLTQQALSQHQHEKWVIELFDGPVRYVDICGNTRDAILLMKSSMQELQSALRRRNVADLDIESNVTTYICFRRKMKKESTKSLLALKQMDSVTGSPPPLDLANHLSAVIRVLREASLITSSIFYSLLLFLSAALSKPKPNRWSFVSKLMQKGALLSNNQEEKTNELERVDAILSNLLLKNSSKDVEAEKIQSAQKRLESLDAGIEGLENGLECLFRHLINARVSFLNILSS